MKKKIHRDFYYDIPDSNQIKLLEYQAVPSFIFIHENDYNNSQLKELFSKILEALKITVGNNAQIIVCNSHIVYPLNEILNGNSNRIISFGIPPSQFQLQGFEKLHHVYHFLGNSLLFADTLACYQNEGSKKLLWFSLKQMFTL